MRYLQLVAAIALICGGLAMAAPASAGEFGTKDEAVSPVKQAIVRVAEVGMDKAKLEFMDHSGRFVDRDLYLIVLDRTGQRIVHGQNPKLVGKMYFDSVDVNGKDYGKDVERIITGVGKGWISFTFKDPITGKVLPKENYVETAGDYTYLAGVYQR